jgi:hypothetical protein
MSINLVSIFNQLFEEKNKWKENKMKFRKVYLYICKLTDNYPRCCWTLFIYQSINYLFKLTFFCSFTITENGIWDAAVKQVCLMLTYLLSGRVLAHLLLDTLTKHFNATFFTTAVKTKLTTNVLFRTEHLHCSTY